MAANASVAAARLGAEVAYWGRVGDEPGGHQIVKWLAAERVDTSNIRRIPGARSPRTAVLIDDEGERLICGYNDPALDDDASWLPVAAIAASDAVLVDVRWPAGARRVLELARTANVPSVLDADVAPRESLRDLCALCDYAIFSQAGLAIAAGVSDPLEGLRLATSLVRGVAGVTLGGDGFLWSENDRECRSAAASVDVVDTLAAGDVFHAAFAVAVAEKKSIAEAAAFANAAAAIKCTRPGGRNGAPTRGEVEALLAREGRA
jgi:sulfofructose kinase